MNTSVMVGLSLALVGGSVFGADQKSSDQSGQFRVTAEFSAAENTIEELTGTPVGDPESQARIQQARAVFQAALEHFPNSTLALNYLARTYAFPGQDMALGIAAFEKSLTIEPNQPDAIARLVGLCLDAGQRSKAAELQARLVNRDANPALAAKVERLIALWDLKEGQRLINEGHPDEGLALIDKALQETSDPDVQYNLREARAAAAREWEVNLYNAALEKAKAGDNRGALAILDKLLPVAKEPEVVQRAKRLRARLAPAATPGKGD